MRNCAIETNDTFKITTSKKIVTTNKSFFFLNNSYLVQVARISDWTNLHTLAASKSYTHSLALPGSWESEQRRSLISSQSGQKPTQKESLHLSRITFFLCQSNAIKPSPFWFPSGTQWNNERFLIFRFVPLLPSNHTQTQVFVSNPAQPIHSFVFWNEQELKHRVSYKHGYL